MSSRPILEIRPTGDGHIPLVGCPVRIRTGDYAGESAIVTRVTTCKERMSSEMETFLVLAKSAKARLGEQWPHYWYEAEVVLPDGQMEYGDDLRFEILDLEQTRGKRFKPGA